MRVERREREKEDEVQRTRSRFIDFAIDGCIQLSEAFCKENLSLLSYTVSFFFFLLVNFLT